MTYEGYASEIPKDNHKAPLLMEHVPRLRYTFLPFAAALSLTITQILRKPYRYLPGIDIEPSRQTHECHVLKASEIEPMKSFHIRTGVT